MSQGDSSQINKNDSNFNGTTEERNDTVDITNSKQRKTQMTKMEEVAIKQKFNQQQRKEKNPNDINQSKQNNPNTKSPRKDCNGIEIISKNKRRIKVSYIDRVSSSELIEIIPIESYKSFNIMANFGSLKDVYMKSRSKCSCFIY